MLGTRRVKSETPRPRGGRRIAKSKREIELREKSSDNDQGREREIERQRPRSRRRGRAAAPRPGDMRTACRLKRLRKEKKGAWGMPVALGGEEGRDKLRKAAVRGKYPATRGCSHRIDAVGEPGELKHLSTRRKRK